MDDDDEISVVLVAGSVCGDELSVVLVEGSVCGEKLSVVLVACECLGGVYPLLPCVCPVLVLSVALSLVVLDVVLEP